MNTVVTAVATPLSQQTLAVDDDDATPPHGHLTVQLAQGRSPRPASPARPSSPTDPGVGSPLTVKPGVSLGGCKLVARIGAGGMGTVWLARQLSLDRNVAVKILRPSLAQSPQFVIQFAHEALAAAQLVHHNIVQIYDTGAEGQLHYFSMEYVEGESLSALLRREGKLDSEVSAGYVLQAARGLEFAHDRGMIHRDIKPENLLINRDGIVKVADLGLVMHTGVGKRPGGLAAPPDADESSRSKQFVGTPAFMAPEQANDSASIDGRADVYSLGCTLYNLVAGRVPFEAETSVALVSKHFFEAPVAPEVHNRRLPAALSGIILKMMGKKPEHRFQTMEEVIDALENFLGVDGSTVFSPREEHAALLEQAVADFRGARWASRRRLVSLALLALTTAGTTASVMLGFPKVGLAVGSFAFIGWICALFINAVAQRATLLLKLRQWVLTAPLWAWLGGVLGLGTALGLLAWFGLLRNVSGVLGLGVLAGFAFFVLVDRKLAQQRRAPLDVVEQMLKEMRLRGLEEQALRQFVCKYSGQDWEPIYEALFGYEAKLQARLKWGRDMKNLPRKRLGVWRDPLVRWVNRRLEARQRKKHVRHLARLQRGRGGRRVL